MTEIFQIKYFHQALFHAKKFANETDDQNYCNMSDCEGFMYENEIYEMRDKIIELSKLKHTRKMN